MAHGKKIPRSSGGGKSERLREGKKFWGKREQESFERALKKHTASKSTRFAAILKDQTAGSFGALYGKGRNSVDLKDRLRNVTKGAKRARDEGGGKCAENPNRKQRLVRNSYKMGWSDAEVRSFKVAVGRCGWGKWTDLLKEEGETTYNRLYGKRRSNVHLKDKARQLWGDQEGWKKI